MNECRHLVHGEWENHEDHRVRVCLECGEPEVDPIYPDVDMLGKWEDVSPEPDIYEDEEDYGPTNSLPELRDNWGDEAQLIKYISKLNYYVYWYENHYVLYMPGEVPEQHRMLDTLESSIEDLTGEKVTITPF